MSFALSAGVTGLQAHQKMLDIAGNNLANVNTTAYKSSRMSFSELLSETIKKASQPTGSVGGTNPQQMGSGVGISTISPNMTQGNIVNTGNPLDVAIEGEGYFALREGDRDVYTRAGTFAVDKDSYLVDPSNGYRVQRTTDIGELDNFQISGDPDIRVPYDAKMPAKATSRIDIAGNLSADSSFATPQTNKISSNIQYTANDESAQTTTWVTDLDQFTGDGTGLVGATLTVSGYEHDGTALSDTIPLDVIATTTVGDVINHINSVLQASTGTDVAALVNGRIEVTAGSSGYSKSDLQLTFANGGTDDLEVPPYFEIATVGGEEAKNINITVFDSQGSKHGLTATLVRTDTINTWDMILSAITGDVSSVDPDERRIEGITFDARDGSYAGLADPTASPTFTVRFAHDASEPQIIEFDLGTEERFDGLTQFAGNSTAVATEQNGYEAGSLSTVSVNNEGILIGAFSNGVRKDIAALQIALFKNTAGLERVGGGYFIASANSGYPTQTQAMSSGAGTVHGGALEKSNADVATEFISLIQAQNGFQANARTIKVANEILSELSNLVR